MHVLHAVLLCTCQVTFNVNDPSFKLDDLLKLELHKFEEEVRTPRAWQLLQLPACSHVPLLRRLGRPLQLCSCAYAH